MRKEFEKFMKSKRAWSMWLKNLKEIGKHNPESYFKYLQCKPEEFIASSFIWRDSKDGLEFWIDLNKEWEQHLEQLKSKGGQNA